MIDFHTHVLPGIDDGSASVEESLALLSALEEQGVSTVLLSPHYYGRMKSVEAFLQSRRESSDALMQAYGGNLHFRLAAECNIATCANADLSDLRPLAIDGTKYILTEMSFTPRWGEDLYAKVSRLMESTGLTPVIAHIELYPAVMRRPSSVDRLTAMGCLLQMNCDSVLQMRKGDLLYALIRHGKINCLGSDTHNVKTRPPRYREAVEKLKETFGEGYVGALQSNMKGILEDKAIRPVQGDGIRKGFFGKYE